ncbi:hypothetical protein K2O51_31555 (plasmid) [Cupriavidus pinatubonensis]|uniref:C2H2-type zinc finger protein n=1 Tax=Cupriavidus pinatubonensis TaxID=248026 RepID=UPI001C73B634|nr:C2H2-type zinc finger protein [Cupriavidus pinatubonensis]QYY33568.1 hypothetical protein K2O51_31555 [Cupriavidus pinatubonensis]
MAKKQTQAFHSLYPDMVGNPNGNADSDLAVCRVCRMTYVSSVPEDVKTHAEEHARLAQGSIPKVAREMLKAHGWALAHGTEIQMNFNPDDGKLGVVYGWWMRARYQGASPDDFDEYMALHFRLVDSIVAGTDGNDTPERRATRRWERFAG